MQTLTKNKMIKYLFVSAVPITPPIEKNDKRDMSKIRMKVR